MGSCELGSIDLNGALWLEEVVRSVHGVFVNVHPYLAVSLCVVGTIMNGITMIVLTRKSMLTPVNSLLCAVALCDAIVMISVFTFITHFFINIDDSCDPSIFSKGWAYFLFAHSQVTVILHATSIWLTVLLAQIRVYTIRRATSMPTEGLSIARTLLIALTTFGVILLFNIPNFLAFQIIEMDAAALCADNATETDQVIYNVIAPLESCDLVRFSLWLNGILFKMGPCILLTVSIVALLKIIREVSQRRKNLAQTMHKKRQQTDSTSTMLVAVLSIFLLTELPQGILHVGNALFSRESFYTPIYMPLGDLMDLLSLINSAVNFIIYCAMSRKFRCVFLQLVFSCLPSTLHKRFVADLEFADIERSNFRPSNVTTDMTRTEQLALTSHRVSTTSMLIRTSSNNNLHNSRMYTSNLLTVESSKRALSPRVSLDGPSTVSYAYRRAPANNNNNDDSDDKTRNKSIFEYIRSILNWNVAETIEESSPERRLHLLRCETSNIGY